MKAFVNARVVDGSNEAGTPDLSVILVGDGGRIDSVGDVALEVPANAEVIDCQGRVVYPGLVDMHTHLRQDHLALFVAHGVTTVRDVGNDLDLILDLRGKTASGAMRGPRIHCAGPLLDSERPMWPDFSIPVADQAGGALAVERLADAGVDGIKLYMGISAPVLAAIVESAHGRRLPVTAHLGATSCLEAAGAGIDSLEHAPQALYASLVPAEEFLVWDKRWTMGQSRYWASFFKGWSLVEPDSPQVAEVLSQLSDRHVALDPTLLVLNRIVEWAVDPEPLRELASSVDPALSEGWVKNAEWFVGEWSPEEVSTARQALDVVGAVVARFSDLGGTVVSGTDAPFSFLVPGASLHEELELLARSGLSDSQVLYAATGAAARTLGWEADVGAIAPGRFADLVVSLGDPLRSIADTSKIVEVYKGGELISSGTPG